LVSLSECSRSGSFEWILIENTLGALEVNPYRIIVHSGYKWDFGQVHTG